MGCWYIATSAHWERRPDGNINNVLMFYLLQKWVSTCTLRNWINMADMSNKVANTHTQLLKNTSIIAHHTNQKPWLLWWQNFSPLLKSYLFCSERDLVISQRWRKIFSEFWPSGPSVWPVSSSCCTFCRATLTLYRRNSPLERSTDKLSSWLWVLSLHRRIQTNSVYLFRTEPLQSTMRAQTF